LLLLAKYYFEVVYNNNMNMVYISEVECIQYNCLYTLLAFCLYLVYISVMHLSS